ncbi:hypothetical protein GCM10020255_107380 [Rhodococcus baikonurensis]
MQDLFDNNDMTGLAEAIKSGDVSAKEVLEFSLDRLDERNPAVNAVISERREEARNEVSNGLPEGPLHGVPFVIKDLGLDVAGLPSTNGSRLFADAVAEKIRRSWSDTVRPVWLSSARRTHRSSVRTRVPNLRCSGPPATLTPSIVHPADLRVARL